MLFDHVRKHLFLRVSSIVRRSSWGEKRREKETERKRICKMIIKNNKIHLRRFRVFFIHKKNFGMR